MTETIGQSVSTDIWEILTESRNLQEAFLEMEEAAHHVLRLRVDNPEGRRDVTEMVDAFAHKYAVLLESVQSLPSGIIEVRLKRTESPSFREYEKIRDEYSAAYYLEDCGGFTEFSVSNGRKLDRRLQEFLSLIAPSESDVILDVGCGRGELSYAMAAAARHVVGVDYSAEAIRIAECTFGGDIRNLSFVCGDVLSMPHFETYSKIVMADVFEHIEAGAMEKLLSGLSSLLTKGGRLFVHTAPNLDYYRTVYVESVRRRMQDGGFLPDNPRSRYEDRMHINEQTPQTLRDTLQRHFGKAFAWTGSIIDIEDLEDFAHQQIAADITAVAGPSLSKEEVFAMLSYQRQFSEKLAPDEMKITITGVASAVCHVGDRGLLHHVQLRNNGSSLFVSRGTYPVNFAYHVYTMDGNLLLFDGMRTPLDGTLAPGEAVEEDVLFDVSHWVAGSYIVRVTLVQEGVKWFDEVSADNVLEVLIECRPAENVESA